MRYFLSLLIFILIGCSNSFADTLTWPVDENSSQFTSRSLSDTEYDTWLYGSLSWNFETNTLDFIPDRTADAHFDVWPMLNPPNCIDCVAISVVEHDPDAHVLIVDVLLRNPTSLTGFFVKGIIDPPADSGLYLSNASGYWHSADDPDTEPPAPFMVFAEDEPLLAFGPAQTHVSQYSFVYNSLSDFSGCAYKVIGRYPELPGEVERVYMDSLAGDFTTQGGFVQVRAAYVADVSLEVTLKAAKFLDGVMSDWQTMREEPDGTWITWFPGEETTVDSASIYVMADTEVFNDSLACRIILPVDDADPTPKRTFPLIESGIGVFVDQLTTQMTQAQMEFMATHCIGSQKLVKNLVDSMRAYNPDFIDLQYHLAFGEGDISNIHGNDWVKNWEFVNGQEDFFEHRSWSAQPANRVLQQDWEWYLTDPESDWVNYFIGNTLERMNPIGDQFDAVFADSASQPWNTDPEKWWEGSDDPHDMFTYWTPKTQSFFDTVAHAYHTLPTYYYLIPNAGSYVTTISDITYNQCDGIMIEGFAHWSPGSYFTEVDWRLQMNRARALAIQDKIILCQSGVDPGDTTDRGFVQGTYMLLQDNYTYFNMLGPWGLEPQWWPEYFWNPGVAVEDWTDISELQDSGGCYVRHFENGIVIVNPSDTTRYYTTEKMYSHTMVGAGGLLPEDGIPTGIATGPLVEAGEQEIPPYSSWLGAG